MNRAAFFDVDNTLVTLTSMFSFLRYDVLASGRPLSDYQRAMDDLRAFKAAGASREEANRRFYRQFARRSVDEVMTRGAEWFRAECAFDPEVLAALGEHSRAGDLVVLVSGSFPPCLRPIADHVRADGVLCSHPETVAGRYVGTLFSPMIGERKAVAIQAEAAARNIDLSASYAYGDHGSDLPMLRLVGHPVVVGDDPEMTELAIRHGWSRMAQGVDRAS
ncbi:HAD family hydrolase [Actinocrispum wychmicini]|uniref:HAD superfamily hydrolase (TIGR01490 family) n=1 Tax=Actinocrispum wychmicini TaxID=1213861 RepID=A0A4V2S844_9PSEU|nr:HAD-IB family hydrolase [Actinocrispum wychmicini]TCO62290.1 HAD superfamily hydrolase (TIGR01490 family) [Actinocrispum wychmicini]